MQCTGAKVRRTTVTPGGGQDLENKRRKRPAVWQRYTNIIDSILDVFIGLVAFLNMGGYLRCFKKRRGPFENSLLCKNMHLTEGKRNQTKQYSCNLRHA